MFGFRDCSVIEMEDGRTYGVTDMLNAAQELVEKAAIYRNKIAESMHELAPVPFGNVLDDTRNSFSECFAERTILWKIVS